MTRSSKPTSPSARSTRKAMIDLSVTAGRIFSPRNAFLAGLRDVTFHLVLNYIPPVKRYFMEMRFKPMPFYENGLVVHEKVRRKNSPVGRMFIQPKGAHPGRRGQAARRRARQGSRAACLGRRPQLLAQ